MSLNEYLASHLQCVLSEFEGCNVPVSSYPNLALELVICTKKYMYEVLLSLLSDDNMYHFELDELDQNFFNTLIDYRDKTAYNVLSDVIGTMFGADFNEFLSTLEAIKFFKSDYPPFDITQEMQEVFICILLVTSAHHDFDIDILTSYIACKLSGLPNNM